MSLTTRQKKIINPYAESLNTGDRIGVGYDYNSPETDLSRMPSKRGIYISFSFPKLAMMMYQVTIKLKIQKYKKLICWHILPCIRRTANWTTVAEL